MQLIKYPSPQEVDAAMAQNEPMLAAISFDGETAILSQIDEGVEHHILLMKAGFRDTDIDRFSGSSLTGTGRTGHLYAHRSTRGFPSRTSA